MTSFVLLNTPDGYRDIHSFSRVYFVRKNGSKYLLFRCPVSAGGEFYPYAANSQQVINDGEYIEWVVNTPTNENRTFVGLSYADGGIGYISIDYCWYMYHQNNRAYIYEQGSNVTPGTITYSQGSVFRITRTGGNIVYRLNGLVCRTVADANPSSPMIVNISIAKITGVVSKVEDLMIGKLTTINTYASQDYVPASGNQGNDYRYSFQGMEHDDEIKGTKNSYDFGARILDPRVGRWLSLDSKASRAPGLTPYRFGFNNPVRYFDPDGNWETDGHFWTAFAVAAALGYDKETAFIIAKRAEHNDNYVHGSFTDVSFVTNTDHPNGWTGFGSWAYGPDQKDKHGLTGGTQDVVLARAKKNILNDKLTYLHLLGDSWAHSYIDDNGTRVMYGGDVEPATDPPYGDFARRVLGDDLTLEHAKAGPAHGEHADKIWERPEEYIAYVGDLVDILANPEFVYFDLSNKTTLDGKFDFFKYVQENGKSVEDNTFLLKSFVEFQYGQKTFEDLTARETELLEGALNHYGREYTKTNYSIGDVPAVAGSGGCTNCANEVSKIVIK
ncbi:MAG: hypothetical protein HWE22_19760 [Flavobacteriales bacterium]|nr:hypothetical protein [Flavobacteriales bacterium]